MIIESLNPLQKEAVLYNDGPLLVLAGPGSGKTRVIVHKFCHLASVHFHPKRLCAITFTNKAAEQMRERISALLSVKVQHLCICTFHSLCARLLRQFREKNFSILDEVDTRQMIRECIKMLNITDKRVTEWIVAKRIEFAKQWLIAPEQMEQTAEDELQLTVAKIYKVYQERLEALRLLDFGDLLMKAAALFEDKNFSSLFDYVLVDEYQDTNHAQYIILKGLVREHKRFCAVADEDQAIYGWRGATLDNVFKLEKEFKELKIVKLTESYRCTKTILSAATNLVSHNQKRYQKSLWTNKEEGERIYCFLCVDEEDEAETVAEQIQALVKRGYKHSEICVLYRINAQSRVLEERLRRYHIPYVCVGEVPFYQRKEIKDLISYLRVIVNRYDDQALFRIMNTPQRGIGRKTKEALLQHAQKKGCSLFDALKDAERVADIKKPQIPPLKGLFNLLNHLFALSHTLSKSALIKEIVAQTDYLRGLEEERIKNVEEFIDIAGREEDESLFEFVAKVTGFLQIDTWKQGVEAVSLMTMHNAKGLEFKVVFIVGMEQGLFPLSGNLDLEEERRLCYVALTRAAERLYLSHTLRRRLHGMRFSNKPSQFLEEMQIQLPSFSVGEGVQHRKWGEGKVVSVQGEGDGQILEVLFEDGVKKLSAKYANLLKL